MLNFRHKLEALHEDKVCSNVPPDNSELVLELEMDDEVKDILNSPEKYADTFLDVTVMKPRDEIYTTQKKIMSSEQVKDFIAAINLRTSQKTRSLSQDQNRIRQKSSGDYFSNLNKQKTTNKKVYAPSSTIGDHLGRHLLSDDSNSEKEKERIHQVYTTPKTFTDFSSFFECRNKNKNYNNDKPSSHCVCKNCAIVGVVADSQKKPFATEPIRDVTDISSTRKTVTEEQNRRRKSAHKDGDHQHCQHQFKELTDKIRSLEMRISAQEQKAVPKDYFKRIITKLLNHISKISSYAGQIKIETPLQQTQSKKVRRSLNSTAQKPNFIPNQKFIVSPVAVNNDTIFNENFQNDEDISSINTINTGLWKWGEDLLKPGIDVKNKVISVMEDTLNNLKRSRDRPKEEELKKFINEFSQNLYKTVDEGVKDEKSQRLDFNEANNKTYKSNRKLGVSLNDALSVTYVNSQVLKWKDTQTTFKFESDKESARNILDGNRILESHKLEFIKTLKNTKEEDKLRLWQSIWNQASKNGHHKNNKVTIQIPDKKNVKNSIVEVEFTLGDLKALLIEDKKRQF